MKGSRLLLFVIAVIAIAFTGLAGIESVGLAAHPTQDSIGNPIGPIPLKNASGGAIAPGSTTPYSPKATCGECHNYESDEMSVMKQQGSNEAYDVPVPEHGVTAGYHFQQGRNLPWDSDQRSYYGLPAFTSSPGMAGKY
ncbi:MAG: hypothetical protein HZA16_11635 [Nitrospirae bacterium]|nr:hypothetical protein [Nitrospirota bacterium]